MQAIESSGLAAGRNNRLLREELELIVWLLISEAFVATFAASGYQPINMKEKENKSELVSVISCNYFYSDESICHTHVSLIKSMLNCNASRPKAHN